jgi:hypothetical protein
MLLQAGQAQCESLGLFGAASKPKRAVKFESLSVDIERLRIRGSVALHV